MIDIFQKIRKQLAAEDKIVRYLKYGIGEIALVVIGILIAVQINNWNRNRLMENNAAALSERLLLEIKQNSKVLKEDIITVDSYMRESELILSMVDEEYALQNTTVLDSLIFNLVTSPVYDYSLATLDEALNTGNVSIIKSDTLRALLYSSQRYIWRIKNAEEQIHRDIENNLMPYLYESFSLRQMDYKFSENAELIGKSKLKHTDNRYILSQLQFENMVDNKYFLLWNLLEQYESLDVTYDTLIRLLEAEKHPV